MKWKACILMLGLFVWIIDTIALPVNNFEKKIQKHSCCSNKHAKGKDQRMPDRCPLSCNGPVANCTNCPLCYTGDISTSARAINFPLILKKGFPIVQMGFVNGYYSKAWKPPDQA